MGAGAQPLAQRATWFEEGTSAALRSILDNLKHHMENAESERGEVVILARMTARLTAEDRGHFDSKIGTTSRTKVAALLRASFDGRVEGVIDRISVKREEGVIPVVFIGLFDDAPEFVQLGWAHYFPGGLSGGSKAVN